MTSLGRMMAGSARVETTGALALGDEATPYRERSSDFYPTPPCAIDAFLAAELQWLEGETVWEPACGDGAIARKMTAAGLEVLGTDLVDRGYGKGGRDFLAETHLNGCRRIVTNPPFGIAEAFIRHALLRLDVPYLALLLKATYWHAATRAPLFAARPPAVIYALTWRPDFLKKGAPTMDVVWCVWDCQRSWDGTRYELLMREPAGAVADLFGAVE
ncbi:hypothetical protein [Bradyrhizobium sp.]|uniref:hypothetical protein n=1 Tax=Bradyrhizobium sp. TaxID=376 RepID=UPI0025C1A6F0|nr:hypothetical protein [Bradyrhizobium sp.]MCA3254949.1 SAM-dependent DNA methyltransferase [Alphaproteobacteria bacterium]MCA3571928.1 SAM-dependent DNA methyltransferase [Bradyrhizobium sp.]